MYIWKIIYKHVIITTGKLNTNKKSYATVAIPYGHLGLKTFILTLYVILNGIKTT